MTTESTSTWNVVYPCYIDKSKSYTQGRKIAVQYAVQNPTVEEIKLVCDKLEVKCHVEMEKSHPRDWPPKGRVRVYIPKSTSMGNNEDLNTKLKLLRKIGSMISLLKSRQPPNSMSCASIAEVKGSRVTNVDTASKSQKKKKDKKRNSNLPINLSITN